MKSAVIQVDFDSRAKNESGFIFLEIVVGSMLFLFAITSLLGLFAGGARLLASGKSQASALHYANVLVEQVRSARYTDIGLTDAGPSEPVGMFLRNESSVSYQDVNYDIQRSVTWVDDARDGLGQNDGDGDGPYDYKRVVIKVRRSATAGTAAMPWVSLGSDIKLLTQVITKPTVEFKSPSPTAGSVTIVGGPRSMFSDGSLTGSLALPLVVDGHDDDNPTGGLTTAGFYINGAILDVVSGSLAGRQASSLISPPLTYWTDDGLHPSIPGNDVVYWNPFTLNSGARVYPDGTYQVTGQVWNTAGGRDSRTITYVLDKDAPIWSQNATVTAEPWQDPYTIRISWSAATDGIDNVSEFNIYRDGLFLKTVNAPDRVTYDTNLLQWTTHSYMVEPVSPGGRVGSRLSTGNTTTLINLLASLSSNHRSVTLTWVKPLNILFVSGYKIYRGSTLIGTTGPLGLLFTENNPPTGTQTYKIVAEYSNGSSIPSQLVTLQI